jgi:GTP-binding protein
MSFPKIAIVGIPNVGKSTLFNRLIGRRQAIVDDIPGVTRDRQYGVSDWNGRAFTVIDTGGFIPESPSEGIESAVTRQALLAIAESDFILLVGDGRSGLRPAEESLAKALRKTNIPVILVVNKVDLPQHEKFLHDFFKLGFSPIFPIAADSGRGLGDLLDHLVSNFPPAEENVPTPADLRLAIVGRPNVGKSTLLNALLGEERAIVHHEEGTTRDPLNILVERGTRRFEFVDTAGIRRKSQTKGKVEKVSVLKAMNSIGKADLALVVLDASKGLSAQDLKVMGYAEEKGKAILLVLNKWDLIKPGTTIKDYREYLQKRYKRKDYLPLLAISAKTGRGVKNIFSWIDKLYENYTRDISTGQLNRVLQKAVDEIPPPTKSGLGVQISYMTQKCNRPPSFLLFSNRPKLVPEAYLRYLEKILRKKFDFVGVPIRWILRGK